MIPYAIATFFFVLGLLCGCGISRGKVESYRSDMFYYRDLLHALEDDIAKAVPGNPPKRPKPPTVDIIREGSFRPVGK